MNGSETVSTWYTLPQVVYLKHFNNKAPMKRANKRIRLPASAISHPNRPPTMIIKMICHAVRLLGSSVFSVFAFSLLTSSLGALPSSFTICLQYCLLSFRNLSEASLSLIVPLTGADDRSFDRFSCFFCGAAAFLGEYSLEYFSSSLLMRLQYSLLSFRNLSEASLLLSISLCLMSILYNSSFIFSLQGNSQYLCR